MPPDIGSPLLSLSTQPLLSGAENLNGDFCCRGIRGRHILPTDPPFIAGDGEVHGHGDLIAGRRRFRHSAAAGYDDRMGFGTGDLDIALSSRLKAALLDDGLLPRLPSECGRRKQQRPDSDKKCLF